MVAHGVKVAGVVGDGVAVSVFALGVVLSLLIMGRSCSDRGDGVAVGVRPDAVLVVVAHGVRMLRSVRGCGGRCGVSARSLEVVQIVSFAHGLTMCKIHYIYKVLVYFQTKIALN